MKKKIRQSEVEAIEDCNRRLRVARSKGDLKEVSNILNQLGNTYRLLGRFEDALEKHKEEVEVSKKFTRKDSMGLGIAYRNLGEVYIDMKQEDKAIPFIKQYLKIAQELKNFVEEQRALITLARTYLCKADSEDCGEGEEGKNRDHHLDTAETYFRKAYKLMSDDTRVKEQLNNDKELMTMKCNNCQNLGLTLEMKGKYDEAVMWLSKAIDIGKRNSLHEYLHPCNSVLAGVYLKLNNANEAAKAAKEALASAKAQGSLTMEVESLILQSKILFTMDEVDDGRKILKRLRKKILGKEAVSSYLEEVESLLILATKITRRQDKIFTTDSSDNQQLQKLHEAQGDNYGELSNFAESIYHYKKSVTYAEACGAGNKKLSRLYFSIAESYKDKGDFSNALQYYEKEMELHGGNPAEQFKTQTNITAIFEKLHKSEDELVDAHLKAIQLAQKSNDVKKEATAYQNYGLYLKSSKKYQDSEQMLQKVNKIKKDNNLKDIEESESDSQDLLDGDEEEIDLNNLSSDEESEEDENSEGKNVAKGKKKKGSMRRNEVGETQLHIAAKKGDLVATKRLLNQHHDINIRDLAGWTPLHEAANFGHEKVVEELLKHGARVNDPGGHECEGITPLHDAASNGHLEIIEMLLKYGANVLAKDLRKFVPIDHLVIWRHSNATDINDDPDLYKEYKRVKHVLKDKMAEQGRCYTAEDETRSVKKAKIRSCSPKFALMKSRMAGDDAPIPVRIAGDDYDPDNADEAKDLYKSAMKGLMRHDGERRSKRISNGRPISPGPRTALIPDHLDVHGTWLEDDVHVEEANPLRPLASKRKRDPVDDAILRERPTRRRRDRSRNELACMDVPKRGERPTDSFEPDLNLSEDEIASYNEAEIEDAHDHESSEDLNNIVTTNENFPDYDEDDSPAIGLNSQASSSPTDAEISPEMLNELQFLPSQLPACSDKVFGRLNASDVADYEDSERNLEFNDPPDSAGRTTSRRVPRILSDDEDDFQKIGLVDQSLSRKTMHTFSSISAAVSKTRHNSGKHRNRRRTISTVQTKLPFKKNPRAITTVNVEEESESPESSPSFRRTSSSSSLRGNNYSQNQETARANEEVLRLKVRVLEHTLLVPVNEENRSKTVEWLCQECSLRYLRANGVKPILSLSTKDGAQLSGSDPISLVIGSNDLELVASVISFDLPPLSERFQTSCSELGIGSNAEVLVPLNVCQSTNTLNLSDFYLRGTLSRALFQSLQRQHSLKELFLPECSLFDEGLKELSKVLNTLPSITLLEISCNGITADGLHSFAEVFTKAGGRENPTQHFCSAPLGLLSLSLSYNPLGNRSSQPITDLLNSLPTLKCLSIADCNFSDKLFLNGINELQAAISKSRLEELDVSFNDWGEIGMEKLFRCLNPSRLRSFNCTSPGVREDEETFARLLATFLSRNEDCCNLKLLKLSDCGLTDDSIANLSQHFNRLVSLDSLDISNNEHISISSVEELLLQSISDRIPLSHLDVGCCPSLWTKAIAFERILLALDKKMQSDRKLNYLRLTVHGSPDFEDEEISFSKLESKIQGLWLEYAGELNPVCKKDGNSVLFQYD